MSTVLVTGMAGMFMFLQGCAMPNLQGLLGGLASGLQGGAPGGAPAGAPLSGPIAGSLPQAPTGAGPVAPAGLGGPTGGTVTAGNNTALDQWPGGALPPDQFFAMIAPACIASSQKTGVPAAVTMAQAALETAYGKSSIGDAKNLFGIKGTGPAGSVNAATTEVYSGQTVGINDNFRKYNSWQESIEDHDNLLSQNSRYASAMAVRNDPDQFAREIQSDGYATEPDYATNLISIMNKYNLKQMAQGSV